MKHSFLAGLVVGLLAFGGQALAEPDPLQVRSWAASCASCHGTNGQSPIASLALAGGDKDRMLEIVLEFKRDERAGVVMPQLAKGYTDDQLAAIVGWFAEQKR